MILPIQEENVFNDATGLKWASNHGYLNEYHKKKIVLTEIYKISFTLKN